MNHIFYQDLLYRHQNTPAVVHNKQIIGWAVQLIELLYPEHSGKLLVSEQSITAEFKKLEAELAQLLSITEMCRNCDTKTKAEAFFKCIPEIYRLLNTDIEALLNGDPAANNEFEIIRTYPGFYAVAFYRIAHALLKLDIPVLPRILTEHAHSKTGIDIHPGAEIGEYLHIDHGTGIVIGETCIIGKNVKLYQGITLGALSVDKSMANTKRHPTVEDDVIIYSGATILGGETVIGHHSTVGGNVWLTQSIPPYSTVYHEAKFRITAGKTEC